MRLPEKQPVFMCDASEHAADYVILTEDHTDVAEGTDKFEAPVTFASRRCTGSQMFFDKHA